MSKVSVNVVSRPRFRVTEDALLDAATAVFAVEGFDRANMDVIAARAGVTKPTLYARVGSKEDLFAAAAQREYDLRKAALFEAYAAVGGSFQGQLRRWTAAYFDFVRQRPEGFRLLSEAEHHPSSAAIIDGAAREIVDRIADLVVAVSGRTSTAGAHIVAAMIAGILTSCAREAARQPGTDFGDAAALCESFLDSALRGVDPMLIEAVGHST